MQRIRTVGEIGFEFVVNVEPSFLYQEVADKVAKLRLLGMSYRQIGDALQIDDKTAKKADQWLKEKL